MCVKCQMSKPLDDAQLLPVFKSLGIHGAALQIAGQAR